MSVKPESFAMKTMFSFTGKRGELPLGFKIGQRRAAWPAASEWYQTRQPGPQVPHPRQRSQKDPQSKSGRGFCCWETRGTGDRDFAAGGEEARRSGRGAHLAGLSLES